MDYKINFSHYKSNFSLPSSIVGDDLKSVDSDYLKVILMIFKNPDKNYSVNLLSNLLNLPDSQVSAAIQYWIRRGVLLPGSEDKEVQFHVVSEKKQFVLSKPENDSELQFLLSSIADILNRPMTSTDLKTITYIYEYYRLPADVILMAAQYSVDRGKNNIKYIEGVCVSWYDKGITSHTMAEEYLKQASRHKSNEFKIRKLFGLGERKLLPSEEKYIESWFLEFGYDIDIIGLAYERTIQNTGKVAFAYTNKILSNWHDKGYRTLEDILANEPSRKKSGSGNSGSNSYDIDMLDKYWDTIPTLDE